MSNFDQNALAFLQSTYKLSADQLEKLISLATNNKRKAYSDIYFQLGTEEGITLQQGTIMKPYRNIVGGAGLRSVIGEKTGYSFTDNVNYRNLAKAAKTAGAIVKYGSGTESIDDDSCTASSRLTDLYPADTLLDVSLAEKIALLRKIDELVRALDKRITNVTASLFVSEETIVIATSLDELVIDRRPLMSLGITCLAEDGTNKQIGRCAGGGRVDFSFVYEDDRWQTFALEAARDAINKLAAKDAPAGEMTVVLGSGWPGILVHEAIGHPLELDFNRKDASVFSKSLHTTVASPLCTLVDDGTIAGRRGSLNVDDEGTPTQRTVLIEDGVLRNYMSDRLNAALVGTSSTGNGRRESYRFAPQPRMTNTFMLPGKSTPEEIISSVKHGLYAFSFSDGQVDVASGNFTFAANGARMIRNGKLAEFVNGATLIDNASKALMNISMVGNDFALDKGIGNCGKGGQLVPVGVGMPTVLINNLTVGGTGK